MIYINKPEDWKVRSVNPLYLMINRVFCFVEEKDGVKYLKIDKDTKNLEDSVLLLWNKLNVSSSLNVKDFQNVKNLVK